MTTLNEFIKSCDEFVSSPEAISLTGYTRSHLAHLCRNKKVEAKLIDNLWYINKVSLLEFVKAEEERKSIRKTELAEKRKVEYVAEKTVAVRKLRFEFLHKNLEKTLSFMVAFLFILTIFNLDAHNFVIKDSINSIKVAGSPASIYSSITNLPESFGKGIYKTKEFIESLFSKDSATELVQTEAVPIPEGFVTTEEIIQNIVQNNNVTPQMYSPVTNITVAGITKAQLNEAIKANTKQIIEHVQAITSVNTQSIVNNYTTIAHTNKIDILGSVDITNSTFSGGSITSTSISGGTGSFTALSVGGSATSTFSGSISTTNLVITDLTSCDTIDTDANGYLVCGTDATGGGGGSFGQAWEINSNGLLAPTTTIAVHIPGTLFASSSASFDGTVTADNFIGTSTATSTLSGGLSATRLNTTATSTLVGLRVTGGFNIGTITGFLKATGGVVATALIDLASDITGILGVSNGGTGQSNIQANSILIGNGTGALATTSAGTNGQVLSLEGGVPVWVATTTLSTISGTLPVASGGTGATTFTNNRILTGNSTSAVVDEANLTFDGSTFSVIGNEIITGISTTTGKLSSYSFVEAPYFNATSTTASTTINLLDIATAFELGSDYITDLTGTGLAVSGNALTTTLGTSVDLTSEITGTLPVANGGTGTTTSVTGGVFFSDGTTFKQDSSNLLWDNVNNRLGIATSSPYKPLSVTGDAVITGELSLPSTSTTDGLFIANQWRLAYLNSSIIQIADNVNDATTFQVGKNDDNAGTISVSGEGIGEGTTGGKFRIGTAADHDTTIASFDISASADDLIFNDAANATHYITFKDSTELIINNGADDLDFRVETVSNTHGLFVDATLGNVGIGTSSPYAKLSVVGEVVASHFTATSTTNQSTFDDVTLVDLNATNIIVGGDTINEFAGTGLAVSGNALTTTLGTSVDLTLEITGTLPVANGGTGATTLNNLITLGTHSTGNYVATVADAGGLTVVNSGSETAAVTVALDLTNPNSWTGLQSFQIASSTLLSVTNTAYFGGTATSTFDSAGVLTLATALAETSGGTGQSTYSTGDILYADGSNSLTKLSAGSNGQVLKLAAGVPSWDTDLSGGGGGSGFWATTTDSLAVYTVDTSDVVLVGTNATSTTGNIFEVLGNSLFRGAATTTGKLSSYSFVEAPYFTATSTTNQSTFDDVTLVDLNATNVIVGGDTINEFAGTGLTVTGNALTVDSVNLTTGVTGTLPVANGGTGVTTLTDGGILLGSGTGAVTAMSVLSNGAIVIGDGTTDPVALSAFTSSTGLLKHESGGVELDISSIGKGDILAGVSAGLFEIVDGGAASDGDVLTIQADGTVNFETPAGGSSEWTDSGVYLQPNEITDMILIGTTTAPSLTTLTVSATSTDTTTLASFLNDTSEQVASITDEGVITGLNFVASGAAATSTFAGGLAIETSGLVYDYSTNNVGIGTASPSYALEVDGTPAGTIFSVTRNSRVDGYLDVSFPAQDTTLNSNSHFIFQLGGSEKVRIDSTGNVGIGTTTPADVLSVQGDVSFSEGSEYRSFYWDATNGRLGIGDVTPDAIIDAENSISINSSIQGGHFLQYNTNTGSLADAIGLFAEANTWGANTDAYGGKFNASSQNLNNNVYGVYGGASDGVNIYGGRFLGEASGASDTTYGVYAVSTGSNNASSQTYGVYAKTSGLNSSSGTGYGVYIDSTVTSGTAYGLYSAAGTNYFNGNVGIGTTTPYAKLSVVGEVVASHFTATSTTNQSTFDDVTLVDLNATNIIVGGDTINEFAGTGLTVTGNALTADLGTAIVTGEITDGTILEGDLDTDVTAVDGDFLQYDSTGTNFTWRSASETLSDIGAEGTLSNEAGLYAALSDVSQFWEAGDTLSSGAISSGFGNIDIGASTFDTTGAVSVGDLTVAGGDVIYSTSATSTVPNNVTYAWTIATSTTASPLFKIDTTTGSETVTIGALGGDVYIGDIGSASNLIFEESSTIHGQGGNTLTFGQSGDKINFAVNVGIGTTTPRDLLDIYSTSTTDPALSITQAAELITDGVVEIHSTVAHNNSLLKLTNTAGGSVGSTQGLHIINQANGFGFRVDDVSGDTSPFIIDSSGNVGIGTTTPAAALGIVGGIYTTGGVVVGNGTGKLTVGTIDPVYQIGNTKYSTYVSGMIGQKEETTGSVVINTPALDVNGNEGYVYEIDFDEQETASDLWLFAKASAIRKHIDDLVVLLTAEGGADVWYVINEQENKVFLLSDKPTTVSYRFTSPRFDSETWTNLNNDSVQGFIVPEFDETVYFTNDSVEFNFASTATNITESITQFFITIGGTFVDDVLTLGELVVELLRVDTLMALVIQTDDLKVGSVEKPSGFTIYDKVTKQPVCIEAINGELVSTPGECGTVTIPIVEEGDTEEPVLTLIGNNPAEIEIGSEYSDLGVTVTDNVNENIGHIIKVNGELVETISLDTGTTTTYIIEYSATDEAGNTGSVERTVIVGEIVLVIEEEEPVIEEIIDTEAPIVSLIGDSSIEIIVNTLYIEEGVTAIDDIDGDISENIVITDNIDGTVAGVYSVNYNISDAAGNNALEVIREVIVIGEEIEEIIATTTPETL